VQLHEVAYACLVEQLERDVAEARVLVWVDGEVPGVGRAVQ
jgi:hypothetical protein